MAKAQVLDVTPKPKEKLKTGIDTQSREKIAKHLSVALARTYILVVKSHLYHWNVVGPLFKSIHDLTEAHYEDMFAAADVIAERIRALGYQAPVDAGDFGISLADVLPKGKMPSAADMISDLVSDHEAISAQFRDIAGFAGDADDLVTEDMLTARIAFHEQASWMLRALLAE
ncbi:Dps family protein [Roseibium aestuarii]|uniref:Dps family protein n=1 Tax=Roseibium aestuarii TaxID=2600299 RepID=A0ABW4JWF6_9HYPH|nr:DNA starvation/stationary phase protection protein [Roseibium aestuarii]